MARTDPVQGLAQGPDLRIPADEPGD